MPPYAVAAPPVDLYGSRPPAAHERLLKTMKQHFDQCAERETDNRRQGLAALEFRNGQQWDKVTQAKREADQRPCLTVNTLPQYERQITNSMRQSMPAITVLPVGNGADVDTAKTQQGIIRHIEQASNADMIRQAAFESAVRIGWGYYRIVLEYDNWMSFDQEPRLALINNPFMVYLGACQKPTGEDADYAFVFEHQDKEAFQAEWGIDGATMDLWGAVGDNWVQDKTIRLAEYFWRDKQRYTLAQLQDDSVILLESELLQPLKDPTLPREFHDPLKNYVAHLCTPQPVWKPFEQWLAEQVREEPRQLDGLPDAFIQQYIQLVHMIVSQVKRLRMTEHCQIRWIKTNGRVILEESIWPGDWIPLIRVVGEELHINNKVHRSGIIKSAMDPMRMENYWLTMQAEHIALSPVPPWLVAVGQTEEFPEWDDAHRKPYAYLRYKPTALGGQPVPAPSRNAFEPPIQAITVAMGTAREYTQNAIGVYRGNLGAPSKERSGVAIAAKDEQADTGTYHYLDNLAHAMQLEGRQYLDLIPKVLTPGKIQRILGDDGSPQMVMLTSTRQGVEAPEQLDKGIAGVYDLDVGTYDVRAEVGANYTTKRQEAAVQMTGLLQTPFGEVLGPTAWKMISMMDWEGARELADLVKQLPGQIVDEGGQDAEAQLAMLKQQLPQLQQQLQALNAFGQECQAKLEATLQENQRLKEAHDLKLLELQLKERDQLADNQLEQQKLELEREKIRWEMRQGEREGRSEGRDDGNDTSA